MHYATKLKQEIARLKLENYELRSDLHTLVLEPESGNAMIIRIKVETIFKVNQSIDYEIWSGNSEQGGNFFDGLIKIKDNDDNKE